MRVSIVKTGRLSKNKPNNNVKKKLSGIKKHINSNNVIFIKKVPQHPRDRRKQLLKNLIKQEDKDSKDDILFVKKVLSHNSSKK